MSPKNPEKTLYLIDGSGYYYRAYYAIKQFLSNSKGLPTNAVYGFALMMMKVIREENPDYLAIAFDSKEATFRHEQFAEYKAHRPVMPDDLQRQIPYIDRLVEAFNIPVLRLPGYEADDLIGTLARIGEEAGVEVTVVTSDKDMMQLVREGVRLLDTMKEKVIREPEVVEKFGVPPDRVTEVMGLMGDVSDNIPGVPGIGEKTAKALIQEYRDIETLLRRVGEIQKPKLRQSLIDHGESARLSKKLATIQVDVPLDVKMENLRRRSWNLEKLAELFQELEFNSLLREITQSSAETAGKYSALLTRDDLVRFVGELKSGGGFAVDTETTDLSPVRAKLVGISVSCREGEGIYIPVGHDYEGAPAQLPLDLVKEILGPVLEDPAIPKYGQNAKYDRIVLRRHGIDLKPITFDTMIASFLLNPEKHNHNLSEIAMERLNHKMIEYKDVVGTGQKEIRFNQVEVGRAAVYSGEDADIAFRLSKLMTPLVERENLGGLMNDMELPLIEVLAVMEENGVRVDVPFLKSMSRRLESDLKRLEGDIYQMAGEEFSINSPKQLSEILFEKRKLKPVRKTKTGLSTDMRVLEQLAEVDDLPAKILEYRSLAKLKSTYVDSFPDLINPETGRIHTSFNQTVAATGRLSSSDPNLQNIPIRTELGKEIRRAFVAPEGHLLLSADYSQIELRILAHLSEDPLLVEAFRKGEDVHARTATEIFGVSRDLVSEEMRRIAKTVNFGILYGMGAYGLATGLKISQKEARTYIQGYFSRYKKVKEFIDRTIEKARKNGFVTTLYGRRRYVPEITSGNRQRRELAERVAVNSPIQGCAADIIKVAMIRVHQSLLQKGGRFRMILQVHDELIFEVPGNDVEELSDLVRENMEHAAELRVPLRVDLRSGPNWAEAH